MRRGPRPAPVTLTEDERQALTSLAHRSRTAPQRARRARIILACADGQATRGIAKRLHLSATTVCKWRTRFLADRIDGLTDEPRPGAPRRITDAQVEDVVVRTLESTPRAQQLNLHRQLADVALGGIQLGGQRLTGLLLQTELDTGQRPRLPRLQAIELYPDFTRDHLQRLAAQKPQNHVPFPARAPPLPRRQGLRPNRRAVGADAARPPGSLRPRRPRSLHSPRPNHAPHLLRHRILP